MTYPKILSQFVDVEINYLKADSNYTYLYLSNEEKFLSSYSLKVFEEILEDQNFVRTDRSHLVNRKSIIGICQNGILHLKNDIKLIIPRRRKASFMNEYPALLNLT